MLTQYVLPLILTAILYGLVMKRVWAREQIGAQRTSGTRRAAFDAKKKQTIVMLVVVTVLFALSYLPIQIWHLLMFTTSLIPKSRTGCFTSTFYMLCYWLAISSCALNPFIYVYYNAEFRKEAVRYWNYLKCSKLSKNQSEKEVAEKAAVEQSGLGASSEMGDVTTSKDHLEMVEEEIKLKATVDV